MLVNLTCGRNPWKRASATTDETFRAFVKNPDFLASILPLTPEMNYIIRRIFQLDPLNRISLPELRHLVSQCPRFTTTEEEDDDIHDVETLVPRPQTPSIDYNSFEAPITPSTPHHGRAAFYKTKGIAHLPPLTPISPVTHRPRQHYDSCSSIASFDSLASHDQRELAHPPRIASEYLNETAAKYHHGFPDDIYNAPLPQPKMYNPVPQYCQQYAMA